MHDYFFHITPITSTEGINTDSNGFDVSDRVFGFRIRSTTAGRTATDLCRCDCPPILSIRTGSFQKSVIVLTQHPFIDVFFKIVSVSGPDYIEIGKPMLETAFHDIARWRAITTDHCQYDDSSCKSISLSLMNLNSWNIAHRNYDISAIHPHLVFGLINGGLYKHFKDLRIVHPQIGNVSWV
ncbi:Protein dennd6a [Mortierella sp. AD032]|nr:Protein dennd6a [Mortierella sp. AD032]